VIGGPPALWTAQQRLAGYREAVAGAGLDPDAVPIYDGDYRQASGVELAAKALAGPAAKRPTAILCANDLMAVGALEHCRSAGLRVPEDVSIVGFDDIPFVSLLTPRLTTVRQPAREMGYAVISLLFDLLSGNRPVEPLQLMPITVQIRESVARPST
jgi:LacI family transcriptional regulator